MCQDSGGVGALGNKKFNMLDYKKFRMLRLPKVSLKARGSKEKEGGEKKTQASQFLGFD